MGILENASQLNGTSPNPYGNFGVFGNDFGALILAFITSFTVIVTLHIEKKRILRSELREHLDKAQSSMMIALKPRPAEMGKNSIDKLNLLTNINERTFLFIDNSPVDFGLIYDLILHHSPKSLLERFKTCLSVLDEKISNRKPT